MLYLTDAEIADLCAPLTQPAAQVRHLRALGLTVTTKPNGRPVVIRSHAEAVLSGRPVPGPAALAPSERPAVEQPNRGALIKLFQDGRRGQTSKVQPA
ncbi:MAG: hypothetical protein AMXMBFR66_05320 [Pseudomonadota bacterium]